MSAYALTDSMVPSFATFSGLLPPVMIVQSLILVGTTVPGFANKFSALMVMMTPLLSSEIGINVAEPLALEVEGPPMVNAACAGFAEAANTPPAVRASLSFAFAACSSRRPRATSPDDNFSRPSPVRAARHMLLDSGSSIAGLHFEETNPS